MYFITQSFLVLGLSKSGKSAVEFLLAQKAEVYIYDDLSNERIEQTTEELIRKGAKRIQKNELEEMTKRCDALVLSPGIPIDHPLAIAFKRSGKAVLGESELAARYLRCPMVAVTGTNGKTTTVSMIAETFQKSGCNAYACGNIGTPMLDFFQKQDGILVAEISSFQLETLNSLRPHVAVILNITEDHLNRHYSMENYVFLKGKLLKNCSAAEYAVLNYDDTIVRGFAEKTKARVVFFSVRERVRGAFYEHGDLYFYNEKIMSASQLPIGGLHNVQNALAVIATAKIMGIATEKIVEALTNFKGVKHRIEEVGERKGVTYINDSKGTNVDATLKAIACMKRETILLLGGKDKGYNYEKLFTNLPKSKVIHAILYGENRYALLKCAREQGYENLTVCEDFSMAVHIAVLKAKTGQAVLLSPASASFDQFSSYEERGDKFVEIVNSYLLENETEGKDTEKERAVEAEFNERAFDTAERFVVTDEGDE